MLAHQGDRLVNLARHILANGINPLEAVMVMPDPEEAGLYRVLEGNRRVSTLHILTSPELAVDTPQEAAFARLSNQFRRAPITDIECVIVPDKATAAPWVEVKHSISMKGAGVERWDALGQTRFEADNGSVRRSKAVMDFLRVRGLLSAEAEASLNTKTTTMDRVFKKYFVETLGVNFNDETGAITFSNGDDAAGVELISRVVSAMAEPRWTVDVVRLEEDRKKWVDGFLPWSCAVSASRPAGDAGTDGGAAGAGGNAGAGADGGAGGGAASGADGGAGNTAGGADAGGGQGAAAGQGADAGAGAGQGADAGAGAEQGAGADAGTGTGTGAGSGSGTGGHSRPRDSLARKCLALSGRAHLLPIREPRLGRLYREALKINVTDTTNAAGLLMRVFLELSSEHYCVEKALPLPPSAVRAGKTSWNERGIGLADKIRATLNDLDAANRVPDLLPARQSLGSTDYLHSIDTLHAYMHNLQANPDPTELKRTWERFQPYFHRLFSALT